MKNHDRIAVVRGYTKLIIFNTKLIIFNTKFIIVNTKWMDFILNVMSSILKMRNFILKMVQGPGFSACGGESLELHAGAE